MDKFSTTGEHLQEPLEGDTAWDGQERRKSYRRAKDVELELLEERLNEVIHYFKNTSPDISAFRIGFKEMVSILAVVLTLGGMWLTLSTQVAELNVKVNERQLSVSNDLSKISADVAALHSGLNRVEKELIGHARN